MPEPIEPLQPRGTEQLLDLIREDNKGDSGLELDAQRELRFIEAIRRAAPTPPADELGWRRLQRQLRRPAQGGQAGRFASHRLAWAASLAFAFFGGILVASVTNNAPTETPVYQTASGDAASEDTVTVAFAPGATEAEIRELLLSAEARVVAGPSAIGLYQLRFNPGIELEQGVERLGEADGIIDYLDTN